MSARMSAIVQGVEFGSHTRLVQHLVALVKNEVLQVGKTKVLVTHESIDTTRSANDDVGVRLLVAEKLDIFGDGCTSIEDTDLDIWKELGEAVVFVPDLICQLASVAHYQDGSDTGLGLLFHLLQGCEDEDGGLSETGLGLAEDIVSEDGLGDGNLLNCGARCMSERIS